MTDEERVPQGRDECDADVDPASEYNPNAAAKQGPVTTKQGPGSQPQTSDSVDTTVISSSLQTR